MPSPHPHNPDSSPSQHPSRPTIGVLCFNIGTPRSCRYRHVARYLRQFLKDPRIIDAFWPRLIISTLVPYLRTWRSAKRYQSIWFRQPSASTTTEHQTLHQPFLAKDISPLLHYSQALTERIHSTLNQESSSQEPYEVVLGMNYGAPSLPTALSSFAAKGIRTVVVVPFFPQYASSSWGAGMEQIYSLCAQQFVAPDIRTIAPYYTHPDYIDIEAQRLATTLKDIAHPYHVVLSYHGIPIRQCQKTRFQLSSSQPPCGTKSYACCSTPFHGHQHCYRWQCQQTSLKIAETLNLSAELYSISFQSRLGAAEPWTTPTTINTLIHKAQNPQLRSLVVMCPSFICDGLETLEEIGIEARQALQKVRSDLELVLVPCANDSTALAAFYARNIRLLTQDLTHATTADHTDSHSP